MSDTLFTSDKNFMKRNPASAASTIEGPNVSTYFGVYFRSNKTFDHNLTYAPLHRTFYEPFLDGKIFECFQDSARGLPNPINGTSVSYVAPVILSWVDDMQLHMEAYFENNSLASNDYPVYAVIYNDYGLSDVIIDGTAATSDFQLDRILSDFDGNTTLHSVGPATLFGSIYLPKTEVLTIPNPIGQKALPTMNYSIDGGNTWFPQRYRAYQPGNPPRSGTTPAVVGMAVGDSEIDFYFTHYFGNTVDFQMFWTLDAIQ